MYRQAFSLFRVYFLYIFFASMALTFLDMFLDSGTGLVGSIVIYGFAVFAFHFTSLTGQPINLFRKIEKETGPTWRFWVAYIAPLAFLLITIILIAFWLASFETGIGSTDSMTGLLLIASMPLFGIALSLVGSMLPAGVMRHPIGLRVTLRRARTTFWFILWRLVAGPALAFGVLVGGVLYLEALGVFPSLSTSRGDFSMDQAILDTLFGMIGFFTSALTASILSMAYLKAGGLVINEDTGIAE